MASLEKRLDRLEQDCGTQHRGIKLLMRNEGQPQPVIPDDGQQYVVLTFVTPKHKEADDGKS